MREAAFKVCRIERETDREHAKREWSGEKFQNLLFCCSSADAFQAQLLRCRCSCPWNLKNSNVVEGQWQWTGWGGSTLHLKTEAQAALPASTSLLQAILMRAQLPPSIPHLAKRAQSIFVATPTRAATSTATATRAATAFHFRHVANFVFMQQISISCYKIARFVFVLVVRRLLWLCACVCVCGAWLHIFSSSSIRHFLFFWFFFAAWVCFFASLRPLSLSHSHLSYPSIYSMLKVSVLANIALCIYMCIG